MGNQQPSSNNYGEGSTTIESIMREKYTYQEASRVATMAKWGAIIER